MERTELTKPELIELLNSFNVPAKEGVPADNIVEALERICFWDYLWEPLTASGIEYNTKVTYQVSVLASTPRCNTLIALKKALNQLGLFPIIQHEYEIEDRRWHSYFALEVLENV